MICFFYLTSIFDFIILVRKSRYLRYPAKWPEGSFDVICSYFWAKVSNEDMKMIYVGGGGIV